MDPMAPYHSNKHIYLQLPTQLRTIGIMNGFYSQTQICLEKRGMDRQNQQLARTYVTGPGKTGIIYTKYTCLYYDTYLLFCLCHPQSVNFIEFLMDFRMYDSIKFLDMIQITDKKLLHFKLSRSGQILHVDKTCFPRPGHICYM